MKKQILHTYFFAILRTSKILVVNSTWLIYSTHNDNTLSNINNHMLHTQQKFENAINNRIWEVIYNQQVVMIVAITISKSTITEFAS